MKKRRKIIKVTEPRVTYIQYCQLALQEEWLGESKQNKNIFFSRVLCLNSSGLTSKSLFVGHMLAILSTQTVKHRS